MGDIKCDISIQLATTRQSGTSKNTSGTVSRFTGDVTSQVTDDALSEGLGTTDCLVASCSYNSGISFQYRVSFCTLVSDTILCGNSSNTRVTTDVTDDIPLRRLTICVSTLGNHVAFCDSGTSNGTPGWVIQNCTSTGVDPEITLLSSRCCNNSTVNLTLIHQGAFYLDLSQNKLGAYLSQDKAFTTRADVNVRQLTQ